MFGRQVGLGEMAKQVLGGLVGVTVTKAVPGMLPSSFTGSPITLTASSIATALIAGFITRKVAPDLASAVMFGGLMQAGSVALNAFLPSVGSTIGLSGLGDLIGPASFTVPQNPLWLASHPPVAQVAAGSQGMKNVNMSGLARAYPPAF